MNGKKIDENINIWLTGSVTGKPTVGSFYSFSPVGRYLRCGSRGNGGSDSNDRGARGAKPEASRCLVRDGVECFKSWRQERCASSSDS